MIFDLPYINHPKLTGTIKDDVINILTANGKEGTAIHCIKVAETCVDLSERFNLDKTIAYCSGILHDVSNIVKPYDMLSYAENNDWYIDESEKKYNFILHQRISAVAAKDYFCISDNNILSAIECHSTIKANASEYDMMLFLADKISWDQKETAPFLSVVKKALDISLINASLVYIHFVLDSNMVLLPHKWLMDAKSWLESTL